MNRREARQILRAYRASGADASDPQFQEALELARQDPELARWFAEEQALDQLIAKKLRTFPVSPRIKEQLLAARKIIPPLPWWRKPLLVAAVAAVALVLVGVAILLVPTRDQNASLLDFRRTMAKASLDMASHLDVTGLSAEALQKWIADHGGNTEFEVPSGLRGVPVAGCKVLDWRGHKVTLLCFKPGAKHCDVFVIHEADLRGELLNATAQIASVYGVTTAAWRRGGKVYVLASTIPQVELEKLL